MGYLDSQDERLAQLRQDGLVDARQPQPVADWFRDRDPLIFIALAVLALGGVAAFVILSWF